MNLLKRTLFFTYLIGTVSPVVAMENKYTPIATVVPQDRSYCDYIPLDMAYVPSLFSVTYQMKKYGVPADGGNGYQFMRPSQEIYKDIASLLTELNIDYEREFYILKLNPCWCNNTTTIMMTNACLFVDEDEWRELGKTQFVQGFAAEMQNRGLSIADPARTVKQYLLKRALAHYRRGLYRKKVASKLVVGAALGLIMYKTMPAVTDYIAKKDADLGVTKTISDCAPTLTTACSRAYVTTLLKWVGNCSLYSIMASEIGGLLHKNITKPLWRYMDNKAEEEVVGNEQDATKKVLSEYNAMQAHLNNNNTVLRDVYEGRCALIEGMLKSHQ